MKIIFPQGVDDFGFIDSVEQYNAGVSFASPKSTERLARILAELEKYALSLRQEIDAAQQRLDDMKAQIASLEARAVTQAGDNLVKQANRLSLSKNPVVDTITVSNGQESGSLEPIGDGTTGVSVNGMLELQPSPENNNWHIIKFVKPGGEHIDLILKQFSGSWILEFPANVNGTVVLMTPDGMVNTQAGYKVNGEQVLGQRITGWEAPTGVAERTTFDTENGDLKTALRRLKALIDDFMSHGAIGT